VNLLSLYSIFLTFLGAVLSAAALSRVLLRWSM
jgi:hypothetical protein